MSLSSGARRRSRSMPTAPRTEKPRAAARGEIFSHKPIATPAKAMCPTPSPINERRRWTRNVPMAGAAAPTTAAAINAGQK